MTRKGKNNSNWKGGKPHCKNCNILVTYNSTLCRTCYITYKQTNATYPIYKKKCPECNNIINKYYSRCKSCSHKGVRNINFGKPFAFKRTKYTKYKDIKFRSSWEISYAKYLDKNKIKWLYEPKAFKIRVNNKLTTYTPDFYLVDQDKYIEIKGWWTNTSRLKIRAFKKEYTNLKLDILMEEDLTDLKVLNSIK